MSDEVKHKVAEVVVPVKLTRSEIARAFDEYCDETTKREIYAKQFSVNPLAEGAMLNDLAYRLQKSEANVINETPINDLPAGEIVDEVVESVEEVVQSISTFVDED